MHGPSDAGAPAITVRGLTMRYGRREVLRGIDLTVRHGEVLALLGPNGAGKTTTVEILEGFRTPTGGHVEVLGEDPAHADEGGAPASAWCCSRGATTPAGAWASCWNTWPRAIPRPARWRRRWTPWV